MPALEIFALFFTAAVAGAINAVAGGGTLITFPTLLFFGTPPIIANATSTLALVAGTSGSIFGYRQHLSAVKFWLWRFAPTSILGGLIGAVLLTFTSNKTFSRLVPFLILFATILFLAQGILRRFSAAHRADHKAHQSSLGILAAILFQLAVAIYGGYFGAGIGILMLACLGILGLGNIYEMNTVKTILGSLINLVATIWFIFAGLIHWKKAVIMSFGAMVGYYLGSHYSQRISQSRVRQIITAIGFIISAVTFYKEFVR